MASATSLLPAVLLLLNFLSIHAARIPAYHLPSYIGEGCKRNDPNLNECIVRKGAPNILRFAKGDPKYRIPVLERLELNGLRISRGTRQVGMVLDCVKCAFYGLQHTKFLKAKVDLNKRHAEWTFKLDHLKLAGDYAVSGQVLLLPITGKGLANITFDNVDFSFKYDWVYDKRSNGFNYVKLVEPKLEFDVGKMNIKLDNLFNGDKLLGDNMNLFLNEHWKDLLDDLKPSFQESLAEVFKACVTAMADLVPYEYLFPEA